MEDTGTRLYEGNFGDIWGHFGTFGDVLEMIGAVEDVRMWRTWRCGGYREVEDTRTRLNKDMGTFWDISGHLEMSWR